MSNGKRERWNNERKERGKVERSERQKGRKKIGNDRRMEGRRMKEGGKVE